ncbi:MAG: hypothetical protein WKF75_08600 [Singulisphaera sp.]
MRRDVLPIAVAFGLAAGIVGCGGPKTGDVVEGKALGQDKGEAASQEHMRRMMEEQSKKR